MRKNKPIGNVIITPDMKKLCSLLHFAQQHKRVDKYMIERCIYSVRQGLADNVKINR